ncbi:MAG TPA: MraY family glycosyltransferase [Candidatus Hydrogenedentes bacterium]|nr:MraY family glycosyltransferase [Candidatus Hydrogenedentota bacterium]HOS01462.1 MraY family glycosyltransferase [Candidatus Hydrogenedentota bacterium]
MMPYADANVRNGVVVVRDGGLGKPGPGFDWKGGLLTRHMLIASAAALCFISLLATALLVPLVMRFARAIGAVDRGGYRKVFQGAMPLLGGLGVALPLIALCMAGAVAGYGVVRHWQWFWLYRRDVFDALFSLAGERGNFLTLAWGGAAIVALGLVDDIKGMRARWKLAGQTVVAIMVCLSGQMLTTVSLPFWGSVTLGAGVGGLISVLWIVGLINAFNLIDGVDGLASGVALVGAGALIALSMIQQDVFVMFAAAALAGSLLAFLFYNFPPARIFLGDTGSMFLGYALALLSLSGAQKSEAAIVVAGPMLALSLPLFETVVSVLRRSIRGVPLFAGDAHHTHHRLLSKGYSQPRIVLTFCGVALLLAGAAIMSALIPPGSRWAWCPYALYAGALLYIAVLAGYLRPASFEATLERHQRNKGFQALARYVAPRLGRARPPVETGLLLELCRQELELAGIEVRRQANRLVLLATQPGNDDAARTPFETFGVKSSDGQDLLVAYAFVSAPDETRRQDVCACLAAIFDGMDIDELDAVISRDGNRRNSIPGQP